MAFAVQLRNKHGKPSVSISEECQLAEKRELWRKIVTKHDGRMKGSVLVNGPVDFEKGNYCTTREEGGGGEFPRQVWAPSIFFHTVLWPFSSVLSLFIHTSVISLGSALHR